MGLVAAALALLCLVTDPALTAKLERTEPPRQLAAAVRGTLDPQSLAVCAGSDVVMRVWFRASIPVGASREQVRKGLTYRQMREGTLVGAVEFPRPFTDSRRQRIPAGSYTLRFALQPDTGDHTGTTPYREFFLLCPAAAEKTAGTMEPMELIELSSRLNEGRHPAVLLLWPNNGPDSGVTVLNKGNGVQVATVRRQVVTGDGETTLGFAITVAGAPTGPQEREKRPDDAAPPAWPARSASPGW
jgi:hypothetical protein